MIKEVWKKQVEKNRDILLIGFNPLLQPSGPLKQHVPLFSPASLSASRRKRGDLWDTSGSEPGFFSI
jgi:hypothetical protein